MSLLLDTHVLLALAEDRLDRLPQAIRTALTTGSMMRSASVTSLWEIEIKNRIGKLPIETPLTRWPDALASGGIGMLPITLAHVLADIRQEPTTKDPFDRLLLGVCAAEGLKLVTIDRQLAAHPLAWRPT